MFPPMWPRPMNPMLSISVPSFDFGDVVVGELDARHVDDRIDLIRTTEADDCAVDGRVAERPGDRDGADAHVVALRDRPHSSDERQIVREARLLEAWVVPAPVVVRECREALAGHRARQEARAHRRVDDYADP